MHVILKMSQSEMFCQSQNALQAKVRQHPLLVQGELRLGHRLNKPVRAWPHAEIRSGSGGL